MREEILTEIRRLATEAGGRPPGRQTFERQTGIRSAEWLGVYWARWGDAVREAGLVPNELQAKADPEFLLQKAAAATRHFGRFPTTAELRLYGKNDTDFPSHGTFENHFRGQRNLANALREWAVKHEEFGDIVSLLPQSQEKPVPIPRLVSGSRRPDGHVYLIKSGDFYKVGRSDQLEQRVKQIRVALPDAATLVHSIRTDDPPGIEAYWHRRFVTHRANGEWFKLPPREVAAFRKRKFQ